MQSKVIQSMLFYFQIFKKLSEHWYDFLQESDKYKKTDIRLAIFSYFKVFFYHKLYQNYTEHSNAFLLGIVRSNASWLQK